MSRPNNHSLMCIHNESLNNPPVVVLFKTYIDLAHVLGKHMLRKLFEDFPLLYGKQMKVSLCIPKEIRPLNTV